MWFDFVSVGNRLSGVNVVMAVGNDTLDAVTA